MAANNTGTPAPLPGWNELDLAPAIGQEALARLLTASNEPSTLLYGAAGSGKLVRPATGEIPASSDAPVQPQK